MIEIGAQAPTFSRADHLGRVVDLAELHGKRHVMLVFYPLDFTPTCSQEVPALEALEARFRAAHTLVCAISVDSNFTHAGWADQLGGISLPLVPDFHPKGEIAEAFGVYLPESGHTDRATIILDASGKVRYSVSVTPSGHRDASVLAAECEAIDEKWSSTLPEDRPPLGLEPDTMLYIRDNCMFSRWALYARHNLHIEDALPVRNVSRDPKAMADLQRLGGKAQAPALMVGDRVMYESEQIAAHLVARAGWKWP